MLIAKSTHPPQSRSTFDDFYEQSISVFISEIIQNRPWLFAAVVFLFFVYVWRDLYAVPSRSSRSLRLRIASIRFECILLVSMNFYFSYSLNSLLCSTAI